MSDWREICITSSTIDIRREAPSALTTLTFDTEEELLWTGNEKGWLCSYFGSQLQKHTSFRAHSDAVCQILSTKAAILSLSKSSLRATSRCGLIKWFIADPRLLHATCMVIHPRSPRDLVIAGITRGMAIVNLEKGAVVDLLDNSCRDVTTMKRYSRTLVCGTSHGEIRIHDAMEPSCPAIHKMQAFTSTLADLIVCGNSILSCGYHQRYGNFTLETMVKVFDCRTLRPLIPIAFNDGPAFLTSHPKMTTTAMILAHSGQLQTVDVGNTTDLKLRQLNTLSYIVAFDVSPSGDALAFADAENNIHLWAVSHVGEPRFTDFSNRTVFPDFQQEIASYDIRSDLPLHSIGMPFYREELFSYWPANVVYEIGKPAQKIDSDILQSAKVIDDIGYAPFHKRRRRNLAEAKANLLNAMEAPRFRSQKAKAIAAGEATAGAIDEVFENMDDLSLGNAKIPNYYHKMEIKYSKFGIEDFDFEYFNHTQYAGLETSFANSYCNSLLQLYNYCQPINRVAIYHAASPCLVDNCLLCELGFLFGMLANANGQNCHSSNFHRSLAANQEATNLGLVLQDESSLPPMPWTNMTQSFNRFLLETIIRNSTKSKYDVAVDSRSSETDKIVCIVSKIVSKCACGFETVKAGMSVVTDLVYTKPVMSRRDNQTMQFSTILRTSIHREGQVRDWCQACRQFQPAIIRRLIQSLPTVLSINTMVQNPENWRHWTGKSWPPSRIGVTLNNGKVQVFQGKDLEKKNIDPRMQFYNLRGAASEIRFDQQEAHMVTFVKMPDNTESRWLLFNDFLVKNVSEDEALSFPAPWKIPSVLSYERAEESSQFAARMKPAALDLSILYSELTLSAKSQRPADFHLLSRSEHIKAGTLVAIDAEFVALQKEEMELRSDGTRHTIKPRRLSLARVSVLRGEGPMLGRPFIDDYIATTQKIEDYLTEFSGIHPDDLVPEASSHYLVPLKYAYKKLHVLVRLGCKFIGHGLKSDFRIINMALPKDQVIDTVDLFYIHERQRKLSLKFLAWYFLDQEIQKSEHDSIEDARTALLLYQKYLEFEAAGTTAMRLKELYEEGRALNFRPPNPN